LQKIYASTKQCQFAQVEEPISFEETIKSKEWCAATDEKMKTLERNKRWELVDLPNGEEVVGLKWIYKVKFQAAGSIQKYKARLVA